MKTERRCFNSDGFPVCFDLCVKRGEPLGPIEIDHWWMDIRGLYAQRGSAKSHNRREILAYYWASVRADNAVDVPVAQERLLLAELLPVMRAQGSRRIFKDAMLSQDASLERVSTLDAMLAANRQLCTMAEFTEATRSVLVRAEFPPETQAVYDELQAQLLDEPKRLLQQNKMDWALECLEAGWKSLQSKIGRRQGHVEEKVVLDALSYEARASFHDLYSVVWFPLIRDVLPQTDGLSPATAEFLECWHTSITDPTGEHVFHGHVLGLHPACGMFLKTPNGRRLMGEWLARQHVDSFSLLLGGLVVAINFYSNLWEESRLNRSGGERLSYVDMDEFEAGGTDHSDDDESADG